MILIILGKVGVLSGFGCFYEPQPLIKGVEVHPL